MIRWAVLWFLSGVLFWHGLVWYRVLPEPVLHKTVLPATAERPAGSWCEMEKAGKIVKWPARLTVTSVACHTEDAP